MAYQQLSQVIAFEAESPSRNAGSRMGMLALAESLRSGLSADALRYHFLAEQLSEVVFHLDGQGNLTFLGPTWTALTGLAVEDVLGQPLAEMVHPEERPRVQAMLDAIAARVQASFRLELKLLAAGGPRWVELAAHSSPTGQGEVLGTLTDVTERRQLQARLQQSDKLATLGMLVPGFTHEMNNPLAFMLANLDYLLSSMGDIAGAAPAPQVAEWREAVGEVREGAERLRQLIGHLRSFRSESQGPVDLHALLDSVGQMVSSTLRSRGRLVRDYGARAVVAGSEGGLRQALLNLVLHAVLSLRDGGDTEENEVRLVTREAGGGHVVVEVHDTGAGLPAEQLSHIFEPGFTPHEARPALSVCRDIVRGLGGSITVTSVVGRGTVFRVTLPMAS
ncbi:PAS domain S-box-containing protein [Archangium gephyra]|uniref:histidine kinase n=1 Tax=Archangium gephyra TaxID=48 RepID=A0AAC8Q2R2_9BACT|nr:ATP-binding protein [Archangium gephyra]AKI99943.1 Sensory box histidine kinase/response regulator [Archangium gephyra]REG33348.1 PAS domain S-box-containing protein [Archangium gephyra]